MSPKKAPVLVNQPLQMALRLQLRGLWELGTWVMVFNLDQDLDQDWDMDLDLAPLENKVPLTSITLNYLRSLTALRYLRWDYVP